jgi:hypothetical protein
MIPVNPAPNLARESVSVARQPKKSAVRKDPGTVRRNAGNHSLVDYILVNESVTHHQTPVGIVHFPSNPAVVARLKVFRIARKISWILVEILVRNR